MKRRSRRFAEACRTADRASPWRSRAGGSWAFAKSTWRTDTESWITSSCRRAAAARALWRGFDGKDARGVSRADVREVEVKVVDGNDALSFYERYGFRMNAHILRRSESTRGESSGAEE